MQDSVYLRMVLIDERREKGTHIPQMLVSGQLSIRDIVDRPNLNFPTLLAKKYTVDEYREEGRSRKRFSYSCQRPSIKANRRPNLEWLICLRDCRLEAAFFCQPVNLHRDAHLYIGDRTHKRNAQYTVRIA